MIVATVSPGRIDLRVGEPFDNAGLALRAAFDVSLHAIDRVNDANIVHLRQVPRVS
jgi:hypothetical protein